MAYRLHMGGLDGYLFVQDTEHRNVLDFALYRCGFFLSHPLEDRES